VGLRLHGVIALRCECCRPQDWLQGCALPDPRDKPICGSLGSALLRSTAAHFPGRIATHCWIAWWSAGIVTAHVIRGGMVFTLSPACSTGRDPRPARPCRTRQAHPRWLLRDRSSLEGQVRPSPLAHKSGSPRSATSLLPRGRRFVSQEIAHAQRQLALPRSGASTLPDRARTRARWVDRAPPTAPAPCGRMWQRFDCRALH